MKMYKNLHIATKVVKKMIPGVIVRNCREPTKFKINEAV